MSLFFQRATSMKTKSNNHHDKNHDMIQGKSSSLSTLHNKSSTTIPIDVDTNKPFKDNYKQRLGNDHNENNDRNETSPRIPIALQHIFLQSNRGEEVHVPPPKKLASKIFHYATGPIRGVRHIVTTSRQNHQMKQLTPNSIGNNKGRNRNWNRNTKQNRRNVPIEQHNSPPPLSLDHTNCTSTNSSAGSNSSSSTQGRDDDPAYIVETPISTTTTSNNNHAKSTPASTKATTTCNKNDRNSDHQNEKQQKQQYNDIVIYPSQLPFKKEISFKVYT
jgi:hypothetical protein